jgi:uncharacterized membrane protein YphA (DoxX/SURF4 family)
MGCMDDSIAQASLGSATVELPGWKRWVAAICAGGLAVLFLVSGTWKLTDPLGAEARMVQALIPPSLALAATLGVGIAEAWAGLLVLIPRWRRWGAWLCGVLLAAFMVYIGVNYNALRGEDCTCFPWLQRVVGPGFFIGDGIMLAMALAAGVWAKPSLHLRKSLLTLAAITVFAGVTYGVVVARQSGLKAPDSIVVDGGSVSLQHGRIYLYFYDPECAHCLHAAKEMAKYAWAPGVKVYAVTIRMPEFAPMFLRDAGLKAGSSSDAAKLREVFKFGDPPYGVALEHGRQAGAFTAFDANEPRAGLKRLGLIE